ncbi:ABC1 kinase family protein [Paenibacillus sp. NPDC058174]|uniref:ABC1 kinase family protein n=1 Tax=Paenibacillus sp. NPDC058174 TaxID=3346366 RepID=UPI0036DD1EFB
MYFQYMLLAVIMIFIIGRLIGTNISFKKQVLASLFSVIVTSTVYWYLYLRGREDTDTFGIEGWLWLLSMAVFSLISYLLFEIFDPIPFGERGERLSDTRNPIRRVNAWFRRQRRYMQVLLIAIRHGVGKNLAVKRTPASDLKLAVSFRKTLESCGGFFIKFGQVLSTRSDLLPHAIIEELSHLQENVARLTQDQVKEILAKELNRQQDEIFEHFEMEPIAAASIGQVHRATLREGGQQAVVKLLRPDLSSKLQLDLDILVRFAAWTSKKSSWARNIGFLDLAKGFSAAMKEETDFRIEARNFAQVSASLENNGSKVKIPHVYRELSNAKVLVIEYLEGASVKSGAAILDKRGIDRLEVGRRIFDCMLEQIFIKGIFHADPHPGNVYILHDGTPALLDFGSVGRLGTLQLEGLKRLLLGFEQRNPYIIMDALMQLVEPRTELDETGMEQTLSQLLVQTAYNTAGSTDAFIQGLFRMIREYGLTFYPNVAGAFRSLITLEGTMLQLNPSFNLMEESRRFAQEHPTEFIAVGEVSDLKKTATNELLELLTVIRRLPRRLDHIGSMLEKGDMSVKVGFFSDKANTSFVTKWISQALLAFVGTAIGGISIGLLSLSGLSFGSDIQIVTMFGYAGILISAILLIRVAIYAVRNLKQIKE